MNESFPPVTTKLDFVRRYNLGEFGNAGPTWESVSVFLDDFKFEFPPSKSLFHLRNKIIGGDTHYNQTFESIRLRYSEESLETFYVSEMAPTKDTLIQGEVALSSKGLLVTYSSIALPMRDALAKQSNYVHGIFARCLLDTYLCPNSQDWLRELLDRYPDHVIEFSTYSSYWGTLPNFNTVFWEVRMY